MRMARRRVEVSLVVLGDRDAEKSVLCHAYAASANKKPLAQAEATDGSFGTQEIQFRNHPQADVIVSLTDTSGEEDFAAVRQMSYKTAFGFLLCFSVKDRQTFRNIKTWANEVKDKAGSNKPIWLVAITAPQTDLKPKVPRIDWIQSKETATLAESLGCVDYLYLDVESLESVISQFARIHEYLVADEQTRVTLHRFPFTHLPVGNDHIITKASLAALQKELAFIDITNTSDTRTLDAIISPRSAGGKGKKKKKSKKGGSQPSTLTSAITTNASSSGGEKKKFQSNSSGALRSAISTQKKDSSPKATSPSSTSPDCQRARSSTTSPNFATASQSAPTVTSSTQSHSPSTSSSSRQSKDEKVAKVNRTMARLGEKGRGVYLELWLDSAPSVGGFPTPTKEEVAGWLSLTLAKPVENRIKQTSTYCFLIKLRSREEWKNISACNNIYGTKIQMMLLCGFVGKSHIDSLFSTSSTA